MRTGFVVLVLFAVGGCATPPAPRRSAPPAVPTGARVVGYFAGWGIYGRNYQVKDVATSGAADRLTDLVYAFGKVDGGRCSANDAWGEYQKPISAAASVDAVADRPEATLRGTFGQLRKLKAAHPQLKLTWSFGGWNGSGGFADAARNPAAFAASCHALLTDQRWAGLFDGIDLDWEYPNACGLSCDTSGRAAPAQLLTALRSAFGPNALITAAVPGDPDKLAASDYSTAARSADWLSAMTYDYFGTGDEKITAPHSPLTAYSGIARPQSTVSATVDRLLALGVPANKILLGIGFYGRGWTGVSASQPGATAAGPAPGTYEKGSENYAALAQRCPPTGLVGGTAYARCGGQWWSYDTPATVKTKMAYARSKALAGAFAWELSGDTVHGDLLAAMTAGLQPPPAR